MCVYTTIIITSAVLTQLFTIFRCRSEDRLTTLAEVWIAVFFQDHLVGPLIFEDATPVSQALDIYIAGGCCP